MAKLRLRKVGVDKGSVKSASIDLDAKPCPTIQAKGIAGVFASQYEIEDDGMSDPMPKSDKPPYCVPTMEQVRSTTGHGCTVVSTFAGCGGSSTGYRMAGFKVLFANEYDKHAVACYKANCAPYTIVDGRDIHKVTAQEIMAATGLKPGELDVFDGSPPCQTFSTAGKRKMSDSRSTLFFEYIRLLRELKPKVFVAENVSGMIKGVAKGYFKLIMAELKASGYEVACKLLDAQWLGVPQARQRVIFIGVRQDLCEKYGVRPVHPKPLPYRYSVREACPWIGSGRALFTNGGFVTDKYVTDTPCETITKSQTRIAVEQRPDDVVHDSGGFVRGLPSADRLSPCIQASSIDSTHFLVRGSAESPDENTSRRPLGEQPPPLSKSQQGIIDGTCGFGACKAVRDDEPCSTVQTYPYNTLLASQRRKFTIGEVKRICSFPDDFKLPGSYSQQWARMGNSVPPLMMRAIATEIYERILRVCREQADE